MNYVEIVIEVARDHAEALSDALMEAGALSVSVEDADEGTADEKPLFGEPGMEPEEAAWDHSRVVALTAEDADQAAIVADAAEGIGLADVPKYTLRGVEEQDWVRLTQSQFEPIHIGKNIWVVPSWHEAPDQNALILELDPGLAFGTGSHPTTRLCMEWLEAHPAPGKTVLDYGCGSGILAMVARKLGAGSVAGVDIDPQAIDSARDNAERNQVAEIEYFLPEAFAQSAHANARFDIVVANILSSPLKLMAPMLSGRVAEGGALILSGVLARQAEEVAAAYAPFIKLGVWAELDGWVALHGVLGSDTVPPAR
ncbi:MAG: 50S ribosomal protein L11 methyltransferase [Burkholderiaceae bacterium]|nr:50S ribosomal protein L11 methyltransferase [Burkholderiaceae bacterium]